MSAQVPTETNPLTINVDTPLIFSAPPGAAKRAATPIGCGNQQIVGTIFLFPLLIPKRAVSRLIAQVDGAIIYRLTSPILVNNFPGLRRLVPFRGVYAFILKGHNMTQAFYFPSSFVNQCPHVHPWLLGLDPLRDTCHPYPPLLPPPLLLPLLL